MPNNTPTSKWNSRKFAALIITILTNLLRAGVIDHDVRLMGQIGFTYKFGLPSWAEE